MTTAMEHDLELLQDGIPEAGVPDRWGCHDCGLLTISPGVHDCPGPPD